MLLSLVDCSVGINRLGGDGVCCEFFVLRLPNLNMLLSLFDFPVGSVGESVVTVDTKDMVD
jgi:hypothetical protein